MHSKTNLVLISIIKITGVDVEVGTDLLIVKVKAVMGVSPVNQVDQDVDIDGIVIIAMILVISIDTIGTDIGIS